MYVSAELTLIAWTEARYPLARVANEPPADLEANLPAVIISRYGGTDQELTIDRPWMDVDVYASTWAAADALAMDVMSAYRTELPGALVESPGGRAVIAKVRTLSAPTRRPVTNPMISRSGASYEVRMQAR